MRPGLHFMDAQSYGVTVTTESANDLLFASLLPAGAAGGGGAMDAPLEDLAPDITHNGARRQPYVAEFQPLLLFCCYLR